MLVDCHREVVSYLGKNMHLILVYSVIGKLSATG